MPCVFSPLSLSTFHLTCVYVSFPIIQPLWSKTFSHIQTCQKFHHFEVITRHSWAFGKLCIEAPYWNEKTKNPPPKSGDWRLMDIRFKISWNPVRVTVFGRTSSIGSKFIAKYGEKITSLLGTQDGNINNRNGSGTRHLLYCYLGRRCWISEKYTGNQPMNIGFFWGSNDRNIYQLLSTTSRSLLNYTHK